MNALSAIILATDFGNHMRSSKHTVLHEICGKTILEWVLSACERNVEEQPIVVSAPGSGIKEYIGNRALHTALMPNRPMAEGVLQALPLVDAQNGYVIVVHGNLPLLSSQAIAMLVDAAQGKAASRLVYCEEDEETRICACYCFEINCLRQFLQTNIPDNVNAEYYIRTLRMQGERVVDVYIPAVECLPVYDRASLYQCTYLCQQEINSRHMARGVTFIDPAQAYIHANVEIGEDTIVYPGVFLEGHTSIGRGCTIYNGCRLQDCRIGDFCELESVVALEAAVEDGCRIGPFVRLRPNTHLGEGCKIGNFVEIKNSTLGDGGKVAHLSYIGDADVGKRINVGCGTAFANYDGAYKHRATLGDDVFLGCHTALVSPVKLGDGAYTAAGSVITEEVPDNQLAIARSRQRNIAGWMRPKKKTEK